MATGGIFKECISIEEYKKIEAISSSDLRLVLKSPAHYKYFKEFPGEPTPAMALGTAIHAKILEPKKFDQNYLVCNARKGSKEFKTYYLNHPKHQILTEKEYQVIDVVARNVKSATKLFDVGDAEVTLVWEDPITKMSLKARLDWVTSGAIVELKSTTNIEPNAFARQCKRFGYHTQIAMYYDGYRTITGEELELKIVAAETPSPHFARQFSVPYEMYEAGRMAYRLALRRYLEALQSGFWPSYLEDEVEIPFPDDNMPGVELED